MIVISNDSDLRLPIQREPAPCSRWELVNPSGGHLAGDLRGEAQRRGGRDTGGTSSSEADFRACQLPDPAGELLQSRPSGKKTRPIKNRVG